MAKRSKLVPPRVEVIIRESGPLFAVPSSTATLKRGKKLSDNVVKGIKKDKKGKYVFAPTCLMSVSLICNKCGRSISFDTQGWQVLGKLSLACPCGKKHHFTFTRV